MDEICDKWEQLLIPRLEMLAWRSGLMILAGALPYKDMTLFVLHRCQGAGRYPNRPLNDLYDGLSVKTGSSVLACSPP